MCHFDVFVPDGKPQEAASASQETFRFDPLETGRPERGRSSVRDSLEFRSRRNFSRNLLE